MGVETELKFRMRNHNESPRIRLNLPDAKSGPRSETDLLSTYFDTRKRKLRRHGLLLRVREADGKHIQTIKSTSGAALSRGEWETEIEGRTPDLDEARGTPLEPLASKKLRRKLRPIFETSVHRVTTPIRTRRGQLELAVDSGRIVAAGHTSRIAEVELELKSGPTSDLFRAAKALERKHAAELSLQAKADRGFDLADGRATRAVFAEPITLDRNMSAIEGFRAIARATLRHFSGNVDAVRRLDPDGVHQMRVGLRRLRAAISLFSRIVSGRETEAIKTELKWLTSELARARELDVFLEDKIDPIAREIKPQRGGKALARQFTRERDAALARARKAVNSPRCRALLIDVLAWTEAPHHRTAGADVGLGKFAAQLLDRRIRKARKDAARLEKMTPTERHKFRIKMKKLRYAAGFFDSLFRGKRERKALARLAKLSKNVQDALGSLNDFIANRQMAAEAALKAPTRDRRARAYVAGIVVGREHQQARPLMKAAEKQLRALRHLQVSG